EFLNVGLSGNLEQVRDSHGVVVSSVTRHYTYDPIFNKRTSQTDEEGHTTFFILDSPAPLGFTLPAGVVAPLPTGRTGNLLATVDAQGNVTSYHYAGPADITGGAYGLGDLISVTDPRGEVTKNLAYDANGNLVDIKDAEGNETIQVFDI